MAFVSRRNLYLAIAMATPLIAAWLTNSLIVVGATIVGAVVWVFVSPSQR